ncbi:MAG: shikimate dehydrogenase [Thermoleophilia bacterium]
MDITGETKLIGILGFPVTHSLSPRMQNSAFDALGLDIRYVPLEVKPEDLPDAVRGLRAMGFLGANVTIPHKVRAAELVDRLEGEAVITGAINTIVLQDGHLIGHNTDGIGFIKSLEEVTNKELRKSSALLIGAGGAARSIAVALAEMGIKQLAIINRSRDHAEELAGLLQRNFPSLPLELRSLEDANEDLVISSRIVINATSIGLKGDLKMPSLAVDKLTKDHVVCDIVYTQSQETPLLLAARGKGASTMGGLGMLLHQGAAAIHLWTGVDPPIDVMREAIEP